MKLFLLICCSSLYHLYMVKWKNWIWNWVWECMDYEVESDKLAGRQKESGRKCLTEIYEESKLLRVLSCLQRLLIYLHAMCFSSSAVNSSMFSKTLYSADAARYAETCGCCRWPSSRWSHSRQRCWLCPFTWAAVKKSWPSCLCSVCRTFSIDQRFVSPDICCYFTSVQRFDTFGWATRRASGL